MNFLCSHLGEGRGGGLLIHIYVWEHIVSLFNRTVDGCLGNLVGMKCSLACTLGVS